MADPQARFKWSRPANMVWWGAILLICGSMATTQAPALFLVPVAGGLLLLAGLVGLAVRG